MDISQKEIDEEEECRILERKIRDMNREIVMIKSELLELYDLNPVIPNYKKRASLFYREDVGGAYSTDALKCCFYQTFMVISDKYWPSNITIMYPTKEKDLYGVRLKRNKNETFTIDNYELPFTLNPEKFLTKMDMISQDELPATLSAICKCIHAYLDRKSQATKFQNYKDRIGRLSISPCHTVMRFVLPLVIAKTNKMTSATIILTYNALGLRPHEITLYFEDETLLSRKRQLSLLKKCEYFANEELIKAYHVGFE